MAAGGGEKKVNGLPRSVAIVALDRRGIALGTRLRALLPAAQLHGPRHLAAACDERFDRAAPHIARLFAEGRPILGLCASGILVRAVAPLLADKRTEPPVVSLAADGSVAVPLLGGHHGANALAAFLAARLGGTAAITTAGDLVLGIALDEPPIGWHVANPERIKDIAAAMLNGEPVALIEEAGGCEWLRAARFEWATAGDKRVLVTGRAVGPESGALVIHPPVLALGIGCERGCPADEILGLARATLADAGLAEASVAAVVSLELKLAEPGIHALAGRLDVPARFFAAARLLDETERLSERSEAVFRATGCWGVAEGAALAAAGEGGRLAATKRRSRRATCAVAEAPRPIEAMALGRGRGSLAIVGIGPGQRAWRTPEASTALAEASDVVGYSRYLDLIAEEIAGKARHDSAIGEEEARVRLALDRAAAGRAVALVSSGDAGIYGVAALVFELIDRAPEPGWDTIALAVCPGISAFQAAAARVGAPLGHDFCAISLSDLLTPWAVIRTRLEAAASADFVVALYNPRSSRRPNQLAQAAAILAACRPPETPVFIARNLGRPGEECRIACLAELADADIDMLSLVIVGSSRTRRLAADPRYLYTPRGYLDPPPR